MQQYIEKLQQDIAYEKSLTDKDIEGLGWTLDSQANYILGLERALELTNPLN